MKRATRCACAALALACSLAGGVAASSRSGSQEDLDRIYFVGARGDGLSSWVGRVERNELGGVVVAFAGERHTLDPRRVRRIAWGGAPPTFLDAQTCARRGAWLEAAAKFRVAARTAGVRELLLAAAQLASAQALLRAGEREPAYLAEAAREAHEFIASHPLAADAARARELEARATLLAGKPREAALLYRALWHELDADTRAPRFDPLVCARAGVAALRALLDAADADAARELAREIDARLGAVLVGIPRDDPGRPEFQALRDEASLGLGFSALAAGDSASALAFFEGTRELAGDRAPPALRSCVDLGLGRTLMALGRLREATLALARVAALDAGDRDRSTLATALLAECYARLPDADAKVQACLRVRELIEHAGDTPAVRRARVLASELGC